MLLSFATIGSHVVEYGYQIALYTLPTSIIIDILLIIQGEETNIMARSTQSDVEVYTLLHTEESPSNLDEGVWKLNLKQMELPRTATGTDSVTLLVQQPEANMQTLASTLASKPTHCILVNGFAGTGKTTLARCLIYKNLLSGFKKILLICKNIVGLLDIAKELNMSLSQLRSSLDTEAKDVLIILDGISDLTREDIWEKSVLTSIMTGREFPNATKLILTRPSGVKYILNHVKIGHIFHLLGVSDVDPNLTSLMQNAWFSKLFKDHPQLKGMCKIPLLAKLLLQLFEKSKGQNNVTITDVLIHIVTEMIKWRLVQRSSPFDQNLTLHSLPEDTYDNLFKLCKFAFLSFVSNHILETSNDKERFVSGFCLTHSFSLDNDETFGFVESVCNPADSSFFSFKFIHPLVHEFLAGYYIHLMPPLDVLDILNKHAYEMLTQPNPSSYWLLFFFGLTWRRNLTIDPTKNMASTLLEFLVQCLVKLRDDAFTDAMLILLLCVSETKETELWKKFASNLGGSTPLKLSVENFEQHMWTIASMMSCSGIRDWNVSANDFAVSRELKNFDLYTSVRMSKVVVHGLGESIHISPKVSIEAASRRQKDFETFTDSADKEATFVNQYQCRAIREILQRIFRLFAEITLKGDASNPAYVSFLTCQCFQSRLQDNIVFDPSLAYHFLEVTSEKTLKKIEEASRSHIIDNGEKAIELVILLKPFVRRVTITLPHFSEKHRIVFMSEKLAHRVIGEGAITCSVMSIISTQRTLHESIDETVSTSPSEMVRPGLPLPQKLEQSLRATAVLPHITTPGTIQVTGPQPTVHDEAEHEGTRRRQQVPDGDTPESREQDIGNGSPHFGVAVSHVIAPQQQQNTTTVTPSQLTKTSIREGTILFTSIPNQIPADLIHPLPDETHQLRRGGNGQIFRGTLSGMNVVYKKTNYRSKEYAIITKLKHNNIVRLLAFMYGAENPTHRRRHYCYHIMPQLSGDCARMVTDKEELTIKELNKKHGNNIRKMGVIRGNLKYLLREVLQGLRYLHSLRIAHRDIKGSNILLNFFCSCTNPLECGCDTKYQVQICDFDAAIELDEGERLPPAQIGSRQSSRTQYYICIPVGTDGFRSPECSMLATSNSPDAFSPPITTRSDIWALGILTARMLIGAIGPTKQRQMALLLLHYHRQRYMHEGLHKPGYLEVDRLITDKLLKVNVCYNMVACFNAV